MAAPAPEAQAAPAEPLLIEAQALVQRYFTAFAALDAAAMNDCLHPEISYTDPLFPNLRRQQVAAMWRMRLAVMALHRKDMSLSWTVVFCEERKAQVFWEANSRHAGGRRIRHKALATLAFWDGRIVRHVDGYNFWHWSRQALGITGALLGWHKGYRLAVQAAALRQLTSFMHSGPRP